MASANPPIESVSERLPRTDAQTDLLRPAIIELLECIPDRWMEFDSDKLTAVQSTALFLLMAAGLVERRCHLHVEMFNHPTVVEATFTATGVYGGVEALTALFAAQWNDWQDAFRAWKSGDQGNTPPFHCRAQKPDEWRLTDEGAIARQDLADGKLRLVVDFVLKQGSFSDRESVRGNGSLVTYHTGQKSANPQSVNITNWNEGGKAFADAFARFFDAKTKEPSAAGQPAQVERSPAGYGEPEFESDVGAIQGMSLPARPCAPRDHLWLRWNKAGLGPAAIRDRWNHLSDAQRRQVGPTCCQKVAEGSPGSNRVKSALRAAKQDAIQES